MNKIKILFICSGNAARSQMAEAFLKKYAGNKFDVYSAGLEAEGIHPYTTQVMKEVGIDISNQYSKPLKKFLGKLHFGYIITVCKKADEKCPTFPDISKRLFWNLEDPTEFTGIEEETLNKFRTIRDQVEEKIQAFIKQTTE